MSIERDGILDLCHQAGVLPSEMHEDPIHGWCVSGSGLRKLAALAPDQARAQALLEQVEQRWPHKTGLQ